MAIELPTGLNRRYASIAGFLLVAIWCWVAFDRPYMFPDHVPWNIYSNGPQSAPKSDVFNYPPLTSSAIKRICAETQFNHSVIFTCDNSAGNVAEVRNSILHCVRYAIAGGGSLVLPKIIVKDEDDASKDGNAYEMEYMFDTNHFLASLRLSCPELRVFKSFAETPNRQFSTNAPIPLSPESLATRDEYGQIATEKWRGSFYEWLAQHLAPDAEGPVFIQLARSYLQYPINSDEPAFAHDFGKILKFRNDVRALATTALTKMSAAYLLKANIKEPILHKSFFGAYLTTQDQATLPQDDARVEARFKSQLKLYMEQRYQSNLTIFYLASDDNSFASKFITSANNTNVVVTTKFDLVKGKDREDLLALGPEQQALVDFLILSKAGDFAGVGYSSLAWNLALMRHQFSEQEDYWLNTAEALLSDELSQIYGPPGGHPEFSRSMWP
jgi:hypothetical protein